MNVDANHRPITQDFPAMFHIRWRVPHVTRADLSDFISYGQPGAARSSAHEDGYKARTFPLARTWSKPIDSLAHNGDCRLIYTARNNNRKPLALSIEERCTASLRRFFDPRRPRSLWSSLPLAPTAGFVCRCLFGTLAEPASWLRCTFGFRGGTGLSASWLETIDHFSFHLLPNQFFNLRKLLPVSRTHQ